MRIQLLQFAVVFVLACAGDGVFAQTLSPPQVLPPAPAIVRPVMPPAGPSGPSMPLPPVMYRPSAYQVWQYYGRTYSGYMRPRVIDANGDGYYLYGGVPFPWVRNYPGENIMPLARD